MNIPAKIGFGLFGLVFVGCETNRLPPYESPPLTTPGLAWLSSGAWNDEVTRVDGARPNTNAMTSAKIPLTPGRHEIGYKWGEAVSYQTTVVYEAIFVVDIKPGTDLRMGTHAGMDGRTTEVVLIDLKGKTQTCLTGPRKGQTLPWAPKQNKPPRSVGPGLPTHA